MNDTCLRIGVQQGSRTVQCGWGILQRQIRNLQLHARLGAGERTQCDHQSPQPSCQVCQDPALLRRCLHYHLRSYL